MESRWAMTKVVRPGHQGVHAVLDQLLGAGVDGGGGLVQDQHRRVGHGRPGDGQQLPLALGQVGAVAGEHGVVPIGQAADEAVGVGQLGGGDALLVGGVQVAVADVLHHRAGEQVGVLEDDAQAAAQVGLLDLVDVDAVVADLAVGDVIEAVDEVGDGGLARAGGAHKGDLLARLGPQADVVEDQLVLVIAEVHVVKDHVALQTGVGDGAVALWGCFQAHTLVRSALSYRLAVRVLPGVDQLHIALVLFGLLVHQVKDTLGAGSGGDHKVDLLAHLGDGVGEALVAGPRR